MANAKKDQNRIPTLLGVSSSDGVTPVLIYGDPITHRLYVDTGGSGGFTSLPATGTVDGSNQSFTFTQLPTYIVSDHLWYTATNKSGTTNWTWNAGALTATMTVPPVEDIFGVA